MGGHMGTKLIQKVSSNPGPGHYESNDMITKTSAQQVAISQAERTDHWVEKNGSEMPGPGNYSELKSTFG